jgi:hypothetical protein
VRELNGRNDEIEEWARLMRKVPWICTLLVGFRIRRHLAGERVCGVDVCVGQQAELHDLLILLDSL